MKAILVVGVCVWALLGWWNYSGIRIRVALAEEQTRFFEEALIEGLGKQSAREVREFAEAIRIYYPSGSKQKVGTHLDLVVERARGNAISQLENYAAHLETESADNE